MNGHDRTSMGGNQEAFFTTEWSMIEQIRDGSEPSSAALINDFGIFGDRFHRFFWLTHGNELLYVYSNIEMNRLESSLSFWTKAPLRCHL